MKKIKTSRAGINAGFSLIELSLALVVISSLAVVLVTRYTVGRDSERQATAVSDLKKIKTAIENYVTTNGYYPCPADLQLSKTDTGFGIGLRSDFGNCAFGGYAGADAYVMAADIDNETDFDPYFTSYTMTSPADILLGTIPCKDIGLSQDCMFDPYGRKYSYSVIPELARSGTTAAAAGFDEGKACNKYYIQPAAALKEVSHIKMLKRYDGVSSLSSQYAVSANRYTNEGDYALIYYGKDGFGAFVNGTQRMEPTDIGGGYYVGDNVYQEINHNLHTTFDEYFFMPDNPLNPSIMFDDVIVFGKSDNLRNMVCVRCGYCPGGDILKDDRIITISCPGCTPANVCTAANPTVNCI